MNWKTDLRLDDLPPDERLEALCRRCGAHKYYRARDLLETREEFRHAHLDEVEAALHCHRRRCGAGIRLYRADPGETEAFVGGLA